MKLLLLFALLCNVWAKDEASPTVLNNPSRPARRDPNPDPRMAHRQFTNKGQFLFQGDMLLNEDQYDAMFGPINTRKAINVLTKRWTKGEVPYAITQSSEGDRAVIRSGLQHWEANTCLKFFEVPLNSQEPHLYFQKNDGCYSEVGMQPKFGQEVSIGQGCESMATVAHEVGHAIGFYHEQSRTDRDNHIKLLRHNMNKTMAYNFDIQHDTDNYGVPYDLGSIMQYSTNSFSVNGKNTMVPYDIWRTYDLGQNNGLSFADVKLATIIYKCADNCRNKPNCQNDGFVDFKCRCRCPPGFAGSLCERKVQLPPPACGGEFNAPTTIATPNFPFNYPKTSCIWVFKAPAGQRIRASFGSFDLSEKGGPNNFCIWDHLEVRTNNPYEGDKLCDKDLNNKYIESPGNEMALLFHSDYDWNTGFQADITFV